MPLQRDQITVDLTEWKLIKDRGAITKTGQVYRSPDGKKILRTGSPDGIAQEAKFVREISRRGFPTPEVTGSGLTKDGLGYFIETSVGEQHFGDIFREEYAKHGGIQDASFNVFASICLRFVEAQLKPENQQKGPSQLREGIQLANVVEENSDLSSLLEDAVAAAEAQIGDLPLVLSHGDLTPFNTLERGVIDFEQRFVAPVGYDAITCVTFHRFFDHPKPDGTGTMRNWEFRSEQMSDYLTRLDSLCERAEIPALSHYFDDFLMLKSVWSLCYEKALDSPQFHRWQWRRHVARYCMECYLAGKPIESEEFRSVGLKALHSNTPHTNIGT